MSLTDLIRDHYLPAGIGVGMAGAGTVIVANVPEFAAKVIGTALYGLAAGMFLLARPEEGYITTVRNYLRRRASGKKNENPSSRLPSR